MGEGLFVYGARLGQIRIYYIFVFIAFLFLLYRFRSKPFSLFLILLFSNGMFAFLGKNIQDIYKIIVTLMSLFWLIRTKSLVFKKPTVFVMLSFLFFTITFLYTANINGDYFTIIFSQYSRYFILFSLFLIFIKLRNSDKFRYNIEKVIYDILVVQIILSVVKLIIMGPRESLVGTVASQGGAIATILPMLAFMFLWIRKSGVLLRKDWWFIAGLLLIGFASIKRAIWFIMPVLLALFFFYIPKRKMPLNIVLLYIVAIPLVFYLGVRLNPTLNPEYKIWGSFNLNYAMNYAQRYNFGDENENANVKPTGRASATLFLYNKFVQGDLSKEDWFGYGLRFMFATNYEEFAELGFDIQHKGSATGIFQTLISNGYIGIISIILLAVSLILHTQNKRLRNVLFIFFFWEYFFYTGIVFREYALAVLLVYAVAFSAITVRKKVTNLQIPKPAHEIHQFTTAI
jgi:hypothetical protein